MGRLSCFIGGILLGIVFAITNGANTDHGEVIAMAILSVAGGVLLILGGYLVGLKEVK